MSTTHRQGVASLAVIACGMLVVERAHATSDFPGSVVADLDASCEQSTCTICHQSNAGGHGTATHPLGVYLRSNGLTAYDEVKLDTLVTQLQNESPHVTGADCFGTPFVDLLARCDWETLATPKCSAPSDAGADAGNDVEGLSYGCSAAPAPTREPMVATGLCALLVAVARKRREGSLE